MNKEFRYTLASNKVPKITCPYCGAKKHWQRYLDIETGEVLPEYWGRCDNEGKCSHWNNPYKEGYAKEVWEQEKKVTKVTKVTLKTKQYFNTQSKPEPEPVFFDSETFKQTLKPELYKKNVFINNLLHNVKYPFEVNDVEKVKELYKLGTTPEGAACFPFINKNGLINAIQEKHFNEDNHTDKENYKYHTGWMHTRLKYNNYKNKTLPEWLQNYERQEKKIHCLFGEHLLNKYPNNPIVLVEAPKTAIYGTLYFGLPETPESRIWLAVGAKGWLTLEKAKVLKGRFVYVFPDLSKDGSTFKEWETKAKEYESQLPSTHFLFSNLLEQLAPEGDKKEGYDIADYLIKQDWRKFRAKNIQEQTPEPESEKVTKVTKVTPKTKQYFNHDDTTPKKENISNYQRSVLVLQLEDLFKAKAEEQQIRKTDFVSLKSAEQKPIDIRKELAKVEGFKVGRIGRHTEPQPQDWSNTIKELESYFKSIETPNHAIKVNDYTTISNFSLFVKSHLAIVNRNKNNKTFLPYLERLQEVKKIICLS